MRNRLELNKAFLAIEGVGKVYFQPPSSDKMVYPCIRYQLSNIKAKHADNDPYMQDKSYTVTVMDFNPDSKIPDKIAKMPKCRFDRFYVADNINHWVFTIYH